MSIRQDSHLTPPPGGASIVRAVVGAEVLVIDKDERVRQGMIDLLTAAKLNVTCVDDPAEAWALVDKRFFSVVVVDLDTPHPNAGVETVATVKLASPTSEVLVLTPRKAYDAAMAAVRAGAGDVIFKAPGAVEYLRDQVLVAAARSLDRRQLTSILEEVRGFHDAFLKRFMAAERQVTDLEDRVAGREAHQTGGEIRLLVAAPDDVLVRALAEAAPPGFSFESATTGGEALDRCSSSGFQMVLVAEALPDLPTSMVVRSIAEASPGTLTMTFSGPGEGGQVVLADLTEPVPVLPSFTDPAQLLERLDELAEAFRAKERERRYTQAFREKHYDFVRRYVQLRAQLDAALQR